MNKFENDYYNKGYDDGFADAKNNIDLEDILEQIANLSKTEKEKIIEAINNCEQ